MPWPTRERPEGRLIDQVLSAWTASSVAEVVVVLRGDDLELQAACRAWPVSVVCTDRETADMKASVRLGLDWLDEQRSLDGSAGCFVAPADLPGLVPQVIDGLIAGYESSSGKGERSGIWVPSFGGRVGHPALLSWAVAGEIRLLGSDEGINRIIERGPRTEVAFGEQYVAEDIDTPEDYRRVRLRHDWD